MKKTFQCPHCGEMVEGKITDSRPSPTGRKRRRQCEKCGKRFTTFETVYGKKWRPNA